MLPSATAPRRRQVLVGGARALLALAVLGPLTSACGGEPAGPDPLEAQLESARRDSALAAAAAAAATPPIARALTVVAEERARHATALVEELARAAGRPTPTETESATPTTTSAEPTAGNPPTPPPGLRDVIEALRRSAKSAAELAPTLTGYRSGLLGSIAAACTASYSVGLPAPGRPR